jgi:hypothetical protein
VATADADPIAATRAGAHPDYGHDAFMHEDPDQEWAAVDDMSYEENARGRERNRERERERERDRERERHRERERERERVFVCVCVYVCLLCLCAYVLVCFPALRLFLLFPICRLSF